MASALAACSDGTALTTASAFVISRVHSIGSARVAVEGRKLYMTLFGFVNVRVYVCVCVCVRDGEKKKKEKMSGKEIISAE